MKVFALRSPDEIEVELRTALAARFPNLNPVHLAIDSLPDGFVHVQALVVSSNRHDAFMAAKFILDHLATDKLTLIRVSPETESRNDFEKMTVQHRGYVRFFFKDEPGPWRVIDEWPINIQRVSLKELA